METLTNILSKLADLLVFGLLDFGEADVFGKALHYFIVTFIQISFLVILVTYAMGVITSYLPLSKIKKYLEKK